MKSIPKTINRKNSFKCLIIYLKFELNDNKNVKKCFYFTKIINIPLGVYFIFMDV